MKDALLPGQRGPAGRPLDHRGRLRRDRPASWPRASAASSRGGRPPSSWSTTTGWSPTTCCARTSTPRTWGSSKARPWPTGWRKRTGVPWATPSTHSGMRTPALTDTATPGLPNYGDSLIIGCADNAAARRAMAECLPGDPRRWLIDAGNDTNWGQVLVGNVAEPVTLEEPPFNRRDLPPGPSAHAPAPRPADGGVDQTARRGLRCRARPHRPGPHHQPDDGVAGATGGPPHGGGHLPLHRPLPGHGAGHGHTALRHPGSGGAGGGTRLRMGSIGITSNTNGHTLRSNNERRNNV